MGIVHLRTAALILACSLCTPAQLRLCVHTEPLNFDPLGASEEASETTRYLTAGVLIRFNRATQQLEPGLATSWKVRDRGQRIDFVLRRNVLFSDGTPFGPDDVAATIRRLNDTNLHSGIADSFRVGRGEIRANVSGPDAVSVLFPAPVAGLELLFDQLAIMPAHGNVERVVLGPFMVD